MSAFQFGSLQNLLESSVRQADLPEIGRGATLIQWTDRTPLTVTGIESRGGRITVTCTEDSAVRVDSNGMSESQEYVFAPNPKGRQFRFKQVSRGKRKGLWREDGRADGNGVVFGRREKYHDFSF